MAKRVHTVVVPKLKQGSASAVCPRGEHVTSGGIVAQFHPPVGSGSEMFPEGMRRTAGNKWTVYGWNKADFIGSRLTAIAYCDQGPVPTVVEKTVPLPAYRGASAIATCPAGTVVVGGGYNSSSAPGHIEVVVRLDLVSATQWVVSMINAAKTATKLTAIAYCGHGRPPTPVSNTVTVGRQKGATARVNCPPGTSIVFGGVIANSPAVSSTVGAAVAPFSWSAQSRTQWVVSGYNVGDSAGSLVAIAYCR